MHAKMVSLDRVGLRLHLLLHVIHLSEHMAAGLARLLDNFCGSAADVSSSCSGSRVEIRQSAYDDTAGCLAAKQQDSMKVAACSMM